MAPQPQGASAFSRRLWHRRLRRLRPLIVLGALVGVVALAAWVLLGSAWLTAKEVTVKGQHTLSDGKILAAANVDLGTPLLRLDLDAVDERVSALPAVAEASVHRAWPHTVAITVTEREPVAAVHRSSVWWVMDAEGVLFRRTTERAAELPLVAIGSRADDSVLREAASVVAGLPSDLVDRVRQLTASSMDSITLTLQDGREVRWGSAAETPEKVRVLSVLLTQRAKVYDVSVPAHPTTMD
jgi:cell division protein FtsQ